jgi:hypothetical protein
VAKHLIDKRRISLDVLLASVNNTLTVDDTEIAPILLLDLTVGLEEFKKYLKNFIFKNNQNQYF